MVGKRGKLVYFIPVGVLYLVLIGGGFLRLLVESLGFIPVFGMKDLTMSAYLELVSDSMFVYNSCSAYMFRRFHPSYPWLWEFFWPSSSSAARGSGSGGFFNLFFRQG